MLHKMVDMLHKPKDTYQIIKLCKLEHGTIKKTIAADILHKTPS